MQKVICSVLHRYTGPRHPFGLVAIAHPYQVGCNQIPFARKIWHGVPPKDKTTSDCRAGRQLGPNVLFDIGHLVAKTVANFFLSRKLEMVVPCVTGIERRSRRQPVLPRRATMSARPAFLFDQVQIDRLRIATLKSTRPFRTGFL